MNPMAWEAPWFVVSTALFVIVMLRANGTYWLGRALQRGARRTRAAAMMGSPGYERAVERLHRWGAPVVSLSFLTIGVQTLVNLAAGATRMPLRHYLPAVTVGCVIWAIVYGTVGTIGFHAFGLLWQRAPLPTAALGLLLLGALAGLVIWRVREAEHAPAGPPEAVPAAPTGPEC